RLETFGRQIEHAQRQAHHALDLVGRRVAPKSHARHDHGFRARHWMRGAAGRQTKTPPLPALPALATSRRTSSPPWRWKYSIRRASDCSDTALATRRPPDFRATQAASNTPGSDSPPPTNTASGGGQPSN